MENRPNLMGDAKKTTTGSFQGFQFPGIRKVGVATCLKCAYREFERAEKTHSDPDVGNMIFDIFYNERADMTTNICLRCDRRKMQKEMQKNHDESIRKKPLALMKKYSFVPGELNNQTFKSFKPETNEEHEALQKVIDYTKRFPHNDTIVLSGDVGTGKSHLAYAASREIIQQGYTAYFITVPDLLDSIKATYGNNADITTMDLMKFYIDADLLVLDDIGAEYVKQQDGNSWVAETVFKIVHARTDKPVIFTTNLSGDELAEHYGGVQGARISSRMKKNAIKIQLTGRDRRDSE
ncbi:ATP-binding protein [Listeria booriae]|uniref:ATP-binding protein n=1 Tax=Listeria booriae TaxID=1552123 RepID=UPI00162ACEB0|nr:ATP-binding protein [Listeria booriae]MBC2391330.1 ATP-binding protein [Listeria booriae]